MKYNIWFLDRANQTWMLLVDSLASYASARTRLDSILSNRELAEEMGLPAPVRILPENEPAPLYVADMGKQVQTVDVETHADGERASYDSPALGRLRYPRFWQQLEKYIAEDDYAMEQFLTFSICEQWTDEDAEIAAGLGLTLGYFDQDWRDSQIFACQGDVEEAWSYVGDPIDNQIAWYIA